MLTESLLDAFFYFVLFPSLHWLNYPSSSTRTEDREEYISGAPRTPCRRSRASYYYFFSFSFLNRWHLIRISQSFSFYLQPFSWIAFPILFMILLCMLLVFTYVIIYPCCMITTLSSCGERMEQMVDGLCIIPLWDHRFESPQLFCCSASFCFLTPKRT